MASSWVFHSLDLVCKWPWLLQESFPPHDHTRNIRAPRVVIGLLLSDDANDHVHVNGRDLGSYHQRQHHDDAHVYVHVYFVEQLRNLSHLS